MPAPPTPPASAADDKDGAHEKEFDVLAAAIVLVYGVIAVVSLLGVLVVSVPAATGAEGAALDWPSGDLPIVDGTPELALLLVAGSAGALGALTHSVKMMTLKVANRAFDWRWLPWNLTHPLRGAIIGLVVYATLRAGLVVVNGGGTPTHAFGVLAICGVAGLTVDRTVIWLGKKFESWMGEEDPEEKAYNAKRAKRDERERTKPVAVGGPPREAGPEGAVPPLRPARGR